MKELPGQMEAERIAGEHKANVVRTDLSHRVQDLERSVAAQRDALQAP